ncbi:1,4-dihydroxy-2-naphthoate octaprenyltransferase [Cohaesibacter sp. ES.047]|uniref:1,4-dihydroxy-2-naphthoate octaprenyltransferase n=1 Tax=Cohaesibacter sp. ES.047 TaxID=1798205 RepID=UPI0012FDDAD1|nr:1,4-dihydroxy-2-naphthoate octaprenyltransferase [Cohaesibacter sp. ES.047]
MAGQTLQERSKGFIWLLAMRPKTLILSIAPVLLAGLLAFEGRSTVAWLVFPIILISATSIQIATNLWNDAADAGTGLDQAETRLGPPRMTSLGLLQGHHVRLAAVFFLGLSALCGLFLVFYGGMPILMIGIVGIVCAFGYSSGPYPISGSPFGELFVIVFFGIMSVMGSYYLLTGEWTLLSFWSGFYIGLPAAAVLTVNNHRDRVGDKEGGRRTLAILLGPEKTKQLYAALLLLSCVGLIHISNLLDHGTLSLVSLLVTALVMAFAVAFPIRKMFLATTPYDHIKSLMRTSLFQFVLIIAFFAIQFLT